ncbi:hypothetical protein [Agrococcus sp. ARC_14]|uniref:hypothetical protein n=1 Tax=Agrococcus sp. ARC_14 TaxID=2919927 RepID=UPI001F05939A|nr:hypothetical protein [Agrococcus sp. ARC_14]MCH1883850.1 hypothetical protein [Agrococcus sp. ARC_14]
MVERIEKNMGPEALRAATGRDHEQWRALLEAAGALQWTHAQTARWLVAEHGVDGWWAQGITVDFEQQRKGRLPGQQADGTFSVSVTRTVPGERLEALAAVRARIESRHGAAHRENLAASQPVVRWRLGDGTRLAAAAQPPNKTGTPVTLTIEKLADASAMERAKAEIAEILAAVTG